MEKKFLFFILLFLFGVKSLSAALQVDSLATYEKPMGSEKIEITSWCESPAQSWVLYTGEVNNPVKNALNSSERCFQVTLGANHNWKKNFLTFNLKSPIIITENNRFLHIKHYREILNDNWMVCLNTDQDLSESLNYKCRFNGNNSKAGEWETIVIDLKYLMITNTPLSKFSFGISMDWSGPRDNPGAIYLFDDIVLSESNAVPVEKVEYSTFPNGKDWIDDRGIPINAHGGQIIYENDTYYWIGEARNRFTTLGISCYSSKDLYNWKYEGHILDMQNAEFKTDMQDVAHGRLLERPKVVYNKKTKKYVMWVHWENGANYSEARVMVAEGDKITGPFRFVKTFRPNATMSRDQTLFQDTDDAVYQFRASEENATMHISKLSDNYLDVANESEYSRIFIKQAYEAPAIFKHNDKYFGIFSGCTGWEPNSAKSGEASNITSEWKYINNPCTDVDKNKTYFSQSAYVLPIPNNENAYIYIGDRWDKNSPGNSSYVFLPITMRTGKPAINWYETWDLSLFDQINSYKQTIDIADGKEIYLIARHCDKFFSMNEEKVVLWKDDYAKNLKVTLHLIKDDWYKVEYNGHFLDYVDNELSFVESNDNDGQLWKFKSNSNSLFFYIINKKENKALDLYDAVTLDNAKIGLHSTTFTESAWNQQWGVFEKKKASVEHIKTKSCKVHYMNSIDAIRVEPLDETGNERKVEIYSMQGNLIYTAKMNDGITDISVQSLMSGCYVVKVYNVKNIFIQKIVINRP